MIRAAVAMFATASMAIAPASARSSDSFCVKQDEIQDVLLVIAPAVLAATGEQCASVLPHGLVLGNPQSELARSVDAAAREAWPRVNKLFIRAVLSEGGAKIPAKGELTYEQAVAAAPAMLGKIITDKKMCGSLDKILKLSEPLPPKNLAGIFVEILRMVPDKERKEILCD